MSLVALANHLAEKGRGDDKMLVHMTPGEVQGLQALALAHGGSLTVNPETGLVEAGWLKSLLPAIAGFALNFIAPGVGTAIGGMLGLGGAAGTAIAVGGLTGLATGSLKQGIMAGLGAYGGASLAGGVTSAGYAGAQEAALSNIPKDAIERAAESGLSEQALRNQIATQATQDFARKGVFDQFTSGIGALGTEAGRTAALQGVGGASGLMRAGTAAMLGANAFVPTATQMPSGGGFQYPPRIRPMAYNQYTGELEQLPMFSAINKAGTTPAPTPAPAQEQQPPGMNSGGIVALANGGTPPLATREQVLQAYRTNPGAELNPNEEAIDYWMKKGLGSFADVVNQTRAANPTLAQQIDAARTAATTQQFATPASTLPNYLGLNAVAAGQPGGQTIISGTAGPGYDYAAATLQTDREKEINQIYRDVLGREAEQAGLKYWADTSLSAPEIKQQIQGIKSNIGVNVDPTQLATPTAAQLAAQRSILADPTEAAIGIARSGVARGLSNQQIADLVNETYGKSFSAQNVADFMQKQGITRPTPLTSGDDTVITPGPIPELPSFAPTTPTLGEPFKPTAPTMSKVVSAYEKGGGSTRMPTITDILPTDRTYTQNQAFALLDGYLKANPNALYGDVVSFARSKGIPEMQARAAYNEFRFNSLTGASKSAYDYLMGRGPYQVNQVLPGNAPLMRPYLEASGISSAPGFFGRKSTPTTPTSQTAQSTGTGGGSVATSGVTGGGTGTSGGNASAAYMGTTGGTAGTAGTAINPEIGPTQRYVPVSGTPITDFLFGTQDPSKVEVVDRSTYSDAALQEKGADILDTMRAQDALEKVLNMEQIERDLAQARSETELARQLELAREGVYGPSYTKEELAMMEAMRKGGLAAVAAASAARGGNVQQYNLGGYSDGGRLLRGPGDGVSDSIPATIGNKQPARLADGEFVIPARIVSEIGNGSTEAGARKLYAMMDRVQRARAKTTGKGKVAKNTRADKYLPA